MQFNGRIIREEASEKEREVLIREGIDRTGFAEGKQTPTFLTYYYGRLMTRRVTT